FMPGPSYSDGKIKIINHLTHQRTEVEFVKVDGGKMVPIKELAEIAGAEVYWNSLTKRAILKRENGIIALKAKEPEVNLGQRIVKVNPAPQLIKNKLFVPINFVVNELGPALDLKFSFVESLDRLTIDSKDRADQPIELRPAPSIPPPPEVSKEEEPSLNNQLTIRKIVIDPGHGGKDSGAIGPSGLMEKEVVLDLAKRLKKMLEKKDPTLSIVLTRDGDYFVPLDKRTSFANHHKADIFVSLHANGAFSREANGFEVFHLSAEASDNTARATAALENGVIDLEKNGGERKDRIDYTQFILADMAQLEFIEESIDLCGLIQKEVIKKINIVDRGIKSAFFYVLKDALMPSVLVEAAFITNPFEEAKLRDAEFREEVASGIAEAILEYKASYEKTVGYTR
ncbi:N-acetylmuramoyl-L-alanine amidase, partial [bacterium]|nr:N-acetylmuramoyl-L-alanine amidase [bacterium]